MMSESSRARGKWFNNYYLSQKQTMTDFVDCSAMDAQDSKAERIWLISSLMSSASTGSLYKALAASYVDA